MRDKIALIGHFPPPIGGVAIHLQRLYSTLRERGIDAEGLSFGGPGSSFFLIKKNILSFAARFLRGYSVVHYHTDESDWKSLVLFAFWAALRRQKLIFSVHTFRNIPAFSSPRIRKLVLAALNRADYIIGISEHVIEGISTHLRGGIRTRTKVITPFLPVSVTELHASVDPETDNFIQGHEINICFNASGLMMYQDMDIYGADILLEVFGRIVKEFPAAGLVMFYARAGTGDYWDELVRRAQELSGSVLFIVRENTFFAPVLSRCEIFVRPTYSDGSSISVMEALSLQKWCVASNAVPRPEGCILFENRNPDDLYSVLSDTIRKAHRGESPHNPPQSDGVQEIINIYRSVAEKK